MSNTVELKSLVGPHRLSGVDHVQVRLDGLYEDANVVRFLLNGLIYVATEDPEDGYRSCMRDLAIVTEPAITNTFVPVDVVGHMREAQYEGCDVVDFVLAGTDDVVLSIGTENTQDYYPWFVGEFNPKVLGPVVD